MNKTKIIIEILQKYKNSIEERGYSVFAIALRGSQNYNLDDECSDIDAICIVLPNLRQLVNKEVISLKVGFLEGEVIINDIYTFNNNIKKGNPNWIEAANSKYTIGDLSLFKNYILNPKALYNIALDKMKMLRHPYPSRMDIIKKIGYDPKQVHHIYRLNTLLNELGKDNNVKCYEYHGIDRKEMIDIKRNGLNVSNIDEEIYDVIEQVKDKCYELAFIIGKNKEIEINYDICKKIEDILMKHIVSLSVRSLSCDNEIYFCINSDNKLKIAEDKKLFPIIDEWQKETDDFSYIIHATISKL